MSLWCAWCRYTRGRFECTHWEREEGQRDTSTPTPTHTLHTNNTHNAQTHNTQHTTKNTQGVIASSAYQKITHVELSLGTGGSPKKPLDLTHVKYCMLCCVSHLTILPVFACVMNVRDQTTQTFVTSSGPFCDRASLFTDHRISGLQIRAKYRHFKTI